MEKPAQIASKRQLVDVGSLPLENPRGVESVYCNNVGMAGTPWDIRFLFTEIVVQGPTAHSELRASVVMSPAHAKAFAISVTKQLAEHEKAYGAIALPVMPPAPTR